MDVLNELLALREIHKGFQDAADTLAASLNVPICVGCGQCCRDNTPLAFQIEGIWAVSSLIGAGQLQDAESIAEGWLLERHRQTPTYEGMPRGYVNPKVSQEFNNLHRLSCPFLSGENRCSIYIARPLPCRAFGVTRIASPNCQRPQGTSEQVLSKAYVDGEGAEFGLRSALDVLIRETGPERMACGLFPTLLFRHANPDKFYAYVADNRIASAKLLGSPFTPALLWQGQLDRLAKRGELVLT